MNFAYPEVLAMLAALLPSLILFFWWSWRTRRRLIEQFVPPRLQASLTVGLSPRRLRWRSALFLAGIAALMFALARPRAGFGSVEVKQRGLDIIVALDTSRSMLAEDAGPGVSRLQRAKLAALDLARLARKDRVGLVAFAGTAFLQCPLTVDEEAFRQSVDSLDTGIIQQGGTALGPAIQTALDAFGTERENVRVLVMFTDGEEHETGASEAADRAAARGMRIYTVGLGSANGELIRLRDAQGNTSYLKDEQGNVIKSALNDGLLRDVATRTGGFYLPLQGARAMAELYSRGLEPLPRADLASRVFEQFNERFQWPLALAIVLLAWEAMMPERARRSGTARRVKLAHPTFGTAALLLAFALAALATSPRASASPASALRRYQQGDFSEAQHEYERLATARPSDPRYRFNAGTSAYKAGDFESAARHFRETLQSPDLELQQDAFYNLGNTSYRLGEQATDPKQRQAAWKQAVQSYEAALKLRSENASAKENLDYVRRQLEALKQQQKPQSGDKNKDPQDDQDKDKDEQKQDPGQDQNQNQDGKKDQDKSQQKKGEDQDSPEPKDSQKGEQDKSGAPEKQDPPKPDPSGEQSDDSKGTEGQEKPGKPEPKPGEQGDAKPLHEQDPGQEGKDPKEAREGASSSAPAGEARPGQMSPQQAMRLLDASKGEEKLVPLSKRRGRARVVKDW